MTSTTPRRIILTGGAGYVGSVLTRQLLEAGHHVTVIDRMYFGRESLDQVSRHPNLRVAQADMRDLAAVEPLLAGADTVVYLADLSNDPSCELKEELSREVNGQAVQQFARKCKAQGVRDFIYYSSCSVYGAGGERQHNEDSITNPVSLYAQLKLQTEDFLLRECSSTFRPVIFRNATLYGLSPRMRFDLAVNIMTLFAHRDRRIFVLGGGEQWRPFLHVADVSEFTVRVLQEDFSSLAGEVFNVGDEALNYQVCDLARLVASRFTDIEVELAPGDNDRRSYRADFRKVRERFGFTCRRSVVQAVDEIKHALESGALGDTGDSRYYNVRRMRELVQLPALLGGERARSTFLPFCLPTLGVEEEQEVLATMRSGWITTGPRVQAFEQKLGGYLHNPNIVALSSCTAALHVALMASGIGPGDEVITTPLTFAATANVVIHCGATPVFADVDPDTLLLDPAKAEAAITPRTKAIIPVDLAGQSVDMDAFMALGRKHGLVIIQDAAHSVGGTYKGKMIGEIADFTAYSFYPIKNMTTIEGGALSFRDPAIEKDLRSWALHGLSKDAWKRYDPNPEVKLSPEAAAASLHWDLLYPGFKYNMTDIQAAIGLHQIDRLEGFLRTRERYARMYLEAFRDVPGLRALGVAPWGRHSWHLFVVEIDPELTGMSRDEFMLALKAENIGTGVHFRPVHRSVYYRERFGYAPGMLPIAERAGERIVSLPLYPGMALKDVYLVIETVLKLVHYYSRNVVNS